MLKIFQVRVGGTLCYFIFCMQNTLQNVSKKPFLKSKILGTPILGVVSYSTWMASACAWACPRGLPRLWHVSAGTGKAMLRETNTKFSWINTIRADFSLASDVQQGLVASGFCSRWWLGLREALPCCSCVIWRVTHQLLHALLLEWCVALPLTACCPELVTRLRPTAWGCGMCRSTWVFARWGMKVKATSRESGWCFVLGALAVMSFLLFPFEEAFLDISEDGPCSYKENLDLM